MYGETTMSTQVSRQNRGTEVLVIGAGAAGLMAAISSAETGAETVIVERNEFAGKKLRITGKGRCNVTNDCTAREFFEAVNHNPKFLYGVINKFEPADTKDFFESLGVPLKTERGRRVFPVSDKAADIRDALVRRSRELGVKSVYGIRIKDIEPSGADERWIARSYDGTAISAKCIIICTGGISYPGTGSTGDGYRMLSKHGIQVTDIKPSLVPIETEEDYSDISGLSLKNVKLTVKDSTGEIYSEQGEMLFTHFGVSGPLVLTASSKMQKKDISEYVICLDLKPALDEQTLDRRLISDLQKYSARDFQNSLSDLLPQNFIHYVVERTKIDPHKKSGEITKAERRSLLETLKSFTIRPKKFRPVAEAIITSGGIDVSEINPKTMELKKLPCVYAAGEIIDVDATTGGYNLQIAFATARAAGISAGTKVTGDNNGY